MTVSTVNPWDVEQGDRLALLRTPVDRVDLYQGQWRYYATGGTTMNGDQPRRVVVCHPDDFADVNAAVMSLAYGDVLVKPSDCIERGTAYVIDPPFGIVRSRGLTVVVP